GVAARAGAAGGGHRTPLPRRRAGRRGPLPGPLPGAAPQGRLGAPRRLAGELVVRRRPPHHRPAPPAGRTTATAATSSDGRRPGDHATVRAPLPTPPPL